MTAPSTREFQSTFEAAIKAVEATVESNKDARKAFETLLSEFDEGEPGVEVIRRGAVSALEQIRGSDRIKKKESVGSPAGAEIPTDGA